MLYAAHLHLRLDLLQQLAQCTHISLLRRPLNAQSLRLIRLRDQMEMHMIHFLMSKPAIVLQYIVVVQPLCDGNLLGHGEELGELVVGDVVELCAVVFGDDEL